MKLLKKNAFRRGILALGALGLVFGVTGAILVNADSTPTITTTIHDGSHNVITTAVIGTPVHANVVVASSTGPLPTGTVDFSLYPNTSCSGVATVQSGISLVNGTAESATTTVGNSGLSYSVHYNGLTSVYPPADGQCQSLLVTAPSPTLALTLSTTSAAVGSSVSASSVLGSATANATGTVSYNVYSDNACTQNTIGAGVKTVTTAIVPNSDAVQFNATGTFYFRGVYSGDQNNATATSSCQSAVVNIFATSTPISTTNGSVAGEVYNDLNRDMIRQVGEAGLPGWTINLYTGTGWSHNGTRAPFMTVVSDSNGNYSFTNVAPGTYSIEEINQSGWDQTSSDYNSVVITNGSNLTGFDFGDATTTKTNPGNGRGNGSFFKKFGDGFKNFGQFIKHLKGHGSKAPKKGDGDGDNDDK